jgi:hypothetical protein
MKEQVLAKKKEEDERTGKNINRAARVLPAFRHAIAQKHWSWTVSHSTHSTAYYYYARTLVTMRAECGIACCCYRNCAYLRVHLSMRQS